MPPGTERYERVPTQDDLYSLHTVSDSYNYGSGVPSSSPPSFHSSANIRPSIPSSNSAPGVLTPSGTGSNSTPSYHTATSRHPLTSSNLAALPENDIAPAYAYPPGMAGVAGEAETLVDGTIRDDATIRSLPSSDPLVLNLHKRISQLETSMGRLLIQNDELRAALAGSSSEALENRRTNCCVSYADDDDELRRMMRQRDNCCVSIGRGKEAKSRAEEWQVAFWMIGLVGFFIVLIVFIHAVFGSGGSGKSGDVINKPGKGY